MQTTTDSTNEGSLHRADLRALLDRLHRSARGDLLKIPGKIPALAAGLVRGRSLMEIMKDGAARDLYLTISPEQGRFLFTFKKGLRPFVEYMQSRRSGFQSTTLSIADGFEYAYYEG